jgi:hypothetical protein
MRLDFDTLRTKGFVPTLEADLNGDTHLDLVEAGDGESFEVRLGDREQGFRTLHASQPLDTRGRIHFGDLAGDGKADFVLFDPRRPGSPIRVGRNRGSWPALAGQETAAPAAPAAGESLAADEASTPAAETAATAETPAIEESTAPDAPGVGETAPGP